MEDLFSPCTRMRDLFEGHSRRIPKGLQELNLDVCTEEFLSTESGFIYADLYAMLGNKSTVAWLTPHAAVARSYERVVRSWNHLDGSSYFSLNADGKVLYALACSTEHLLKICDVLLRLLAASVVHSVTLNNWYHRNAASINFASLAYLMEQCQSLKVLTLICLDMDEDHCRVLGGYSRPGLKIEVNRCKVTSAGTSALAEILGRNQGPTILEWCAMENTILADGIVCGFVIVVVDSLGCYCCCCCLLLCDTALDVRLQRGKRNGFATKCAGKLVVRADTDHLITVCCCCCCCCCCWRSGVYACGCTTCARLLIEERHLTAWFSHGERLQISNKILDAVKIVTLLLVKNSRF
jgi:hypothetical protein